MMPKYLWTNKEIAVGDLCLLVYGAVDIPAASSSRLPDMKLIPIRISKYDEETNEWWLDMYTIKDRKFVPLEVGEDKINCIITNTTSGILGRLIPYNWKEDININYKG